jgi:hypothetical protein
LSAKLGDLFESDISSSALTATPLYFYRLSSTAPKNANAKLVWDAIGDASIDLTSANAKDLTGITNVDELELTYASLQGLDSNELKFEGLSVRPIKQTTSKWFLQYFERFDILEVEALDKRCLFCRVKEADGDNKQRGILVDIDETWRDRRESGFYVMSDNQVARRLRDTIKFDPSG